MDFIITAISDIGIARQVNEDALFVSKINTATGTLVFAVMCDGMGGLSQGEVASASVINAFKEWYYKELPVLSGAIIQDKSIVEQWTSVVQGINSRIKQYGENNNSRLGSTVTVMLLSEYRYFLMNIGDTRAYMLKNGVNQLTVDHTLVEHQIQMGNLTREQAESSSMRNVITRCVGVTGEVYPDFFFGATQDDAIYLLCTDGFRHNITNSEIHQELCSPEIQSKNELYQRLSNLVDLNKYRKETDNISVIAISNKEYISDTYSFNDDDITVQLLYDQNEIEINLFDIEEEILLIHSNILL